MSVRLSVNINKVATLRNSRGGNVPRLDEAIAAILEAGARGITVHPRQDERHIRRADVIAIARQLEPLRERVEFNVEGDPRPELMDLVCELRPHQATLVPVRPGELTSEAGWEPTGAHAGLRETVERLRAESIRVSLFIDPKPDAVRWAQRVGADRVELYTEPFAAAYARGAGEQSFAEYASAASMAHELGMGVNAGHDLDLDNLPLFRNLPHLAEVSIGHALVSRALLVGLKAAVREYLDCLSRARGG